MSDQLELFPMPAAAGAGWLCEVPTRLGGASRQFRCRRAAVGTVADWREPLNPALAIPSCERCAELYRVDLDTWLI